MIGSLMTELRAIGAPGALEALMLLCFSACWPVKIRVCGSPAGPTV